MPEGGIVGFTRKVIGKLTARAGDPTPLQYNPRELAVDKSVPWKKAEDADGPSGVTATGVEDPGPGAGSSAEESGAAPESDTRFGGKYFVQGVSHDYRESTASQTAPPGGAGAPGAPNGDDDSRTSSADGEGDISAQNGSPGADAALAHELSHVVQGRSHDGGAAGDWIADVERPAAHSTGFFQMRTGITDEQPTGPAAGDANDYRVKVKFPTLPGDAPQGTQGPAAPPADGLYLGRSDGTVQASGGDADLRVRTGAGPAAGSGGMDPHETPADQPEPGNDAPITEGPDEKGAVGVAFMQNFRKISDGVTHSTADANETLTAGDEPNNNVGDENPPSDGPAGLRAEDPDASQSGHTGWSSFYRSFATEDPKPGTEDSRQFKGFSSRFAEGDVDQRRGGGDVGIESLKVEHEGLDSNGADSDGSAGAGFKGIGGLSSEDAVVDAGRGPDMAGVDSEPASPLDVATGGPPSSEAPVDSRPEFILRNSDASGSP
ncbi:MAG TPA: hypothetical protein VH951_00455, partial [Dehalococcoidia bacterium]